MTAVSNTNAARAQFPDLTNPYFDLKTGIATSQLQKELSAAGYVAKQFFSEKDKWHIDNVSEGTQKIYFNKDLDYVKNGGKSPVTEEQARAFLELNYAVRTGVMPKEKIVSDMVLSSGVTPTLVKRFHSLKEFLKQGHTCHRIHALTPNQKMADEFQAFVDKNYKKTLEDAKIKIEFIVVNVDFNFVEEGLKKLEKMGSIKKEYGIITDPTFHAKLEFAATSILSGKYVGAASAPITNWVDDMNLYGLVEATGSMEKATMAFGASGLNILARSINEARKTFAAREVKTQAA